MQIVQVTRLAEPDDPLEMIYFVEGANGERLPAVTTANFLNRLDVQHAAILLGYRIQGVLAQRKYRPIKPPQHTTLLCSVFPAGSWLESFRLMLFLIITILLALHYSSPVGC